MKIKYQRALHHMSYKPFQTAQRTIGPVYMEVGDQR